MSENIGKDDLNLENVNHSDLASFDRKENTIEIEENGMKFFVGLLNQIAADPSQDDYVQPTAEVFENLINICQSFNADFEEFIISTDVIAAIFFCLRNSFSTNVCCNAIYFLIYLLDRSKAARKKTIKGMITVIEDGQEVGKSFIHILLKVMRGPSIMPYACHALKILIEKEPQSANYLIQNEHIIPVLYKMQESQADPFKLVSILDLIKSLTVNSDSAVEAYFEPFFNLFFTVNCNYLFLLDATLDLFSLILNKQVGKDFYFVSKKVYMRLLDITSISMKNDNSGMILGKVIEIFNELFIRFRNDPDFNSEYVFQFMDKLRELIEAYPNFPFKSRIFFLFSNFILDQRYVSAIVKKEFPLSLLTLTDDLTMKEKETFFIWICNAINQIPDVMYNIQSIGDIFSDMLMFASSAFNKTFHILYLNTLKTTIQLNPALLECIDLDDMSSYLDDLNDDDQFLGIDNANVLLCEVHSLLFGDE